MNNQNYTQLQQKPLSPKGNIWKIGFFILIFIFIIFFVWSFYTIANFYNMRFKMDQNISDLNEKLKDQNRKFTLDNNSLVGIWHDTPSMPSGWSTHYNFYPSGKYTYYYSSMDCSKNKISESGYWKVNGPNLQLEKITETVLVGGKLINSSGSCGTEKTLIDASVKRNILVKKESQEIKLIPFTTSKQSQIVYPGIIFNNIPLWKFSDDPYEYGTDDKFPEPEGF